jgi:virginiamycin B lyase
VRGDVQCFSDPAGLVASPTGIIGAGGDVWFTSIANGRIGRVVASTGAVETYAGTDGEIVLPANIFPAPDGRVWFTCLGSNRLGVLDPTADDIASSIQTYADERLAGPVALKVAAGGSMWCSLRRAQTIACFDPAGEEPLSSLRTFSSPAIADPSALFAHPDGRIWWVNSAVATIATLDPGAPDPATTIRSFGPWPAWGAPRAWAIEASGRLWVTTQDRAGLLTFHPDDIDAADAFTWWTDDGLRVPDGVWVGADECVWAVDTDANHLVRFDPAATGPNRWSRYGSPPEVDGPFDIKPSDPADEWLWFTNKNGNSIGRIRTR